MIALPVLWLLCWVLGASWHAYAGVLVVLLWNRIADATARRD